jgi:hypothetical protein
MISQLSSEGISVSVDGAQIPIWRISGEAIGYTDQAIVDAGGNAVADGLDESAAVGEVVSSNIGLKEAVAYETLMQLLYDQAAAKGTIVTIPDATSYAQNLYNQYFHDYENPSPYTTPLKSPPTQSEFLSTSAVQTYQFDLTVDQQKAGIVGSGSGNGTPALATWLSNQLADNSVSVTAVQGITSANDLGSLLPSNL